MEANTMFRNFSLNTKQCVLLEEVKELILVFTFAINQNECSYEN